MFKHSHLSKNSPQHLLVNTVKGLLAVQKADDTQTLPVPGQSLDALIDNFERFTGFTFQIYVFV